MSGWAALGSWKRTPLHGISEPVSALEYSFALKYEFSACHFHMPCIHWLLLWRRAREWPGRTAPLDGANIDQSRGPSVSTPLCCHQTEPSSSHKQSHLWRQENYYCFLLTYFFLSFCVLPGVLCICISLAFPFFRHLFVIEPLLFGHYVQERDNPNVD
jgi:hypothetical protein